MLRISKVELRKRQCPAIGPPKHYKIDDDIDDANNKWSINKKVKTKIYA